MSHNKTFSVRFLFLGLFYSSYALQCRDESDNPVDWFVIYKLPKEKGHSNSLVKEGLAYSFMTSMNYSAWTLSRISINDTTSMPAKSLSDLFAHKTKDSLLYILYNDQPPEVSASSSYGHTKGLVLANEKQGIWLIHSVPHYPYRLDQYVYPSTGVEYGQSFLCISMDLTNLDNVGTQLQYNHPYIYAQNVPESLQKTLPKLYKAAYNKTIKSSPYYNVQNLKSKSGTKFVSFAKAGEFSKDLYADLVSTKLETDLFVETWPNEPNRLPSNCDNKFEVDNVKSISMSTAAIIFNSTRDHSKWAVSASQDTEKWLCIGDINRAESQTLRGGGTTCLRNEKLASQYEGIVSSLQGCNNEFNRIEDFS